MKATEVTAGLAASNGSLLPGLWRDSLHVTCGLTACTPGSARGPTLGNEYGKTYLFTGASTLKSRALCGPVVNTSSAAASDEVGRHFAADVSDTQRRVRLARFSDCTVDVRRLHLQDPGNTKWSK